MARKRKTLAPQIDVEEYINQKTGEVSHRVVPPSKTHLDALGRELLDSTPMAPPVGYVRQPTMVDIIRAQIRGERLREEAANMGMESFEEADDFEIPDDPVDPSSPYEEIFDPEPRRQAPRTAQEELDPARPHRQPPKPPAKPPAAAPAAATAPAPTTPPAPPASGS